MAITFHNITEAEILLDKKIRSQKQLPLMAKELSCNRKISVLLKAGHLTDNKLINVFYNAEDDNILELESKRVYTKNTHGTGCTLSSTIASFIALGLSLNVAVRNTNDYIHRAIKSGAEYIIGKGHGPVHYFYKFW